jgi:hypothetical protein
VANLGAGAASQGWSRGWHCGDWRGCGDRVRRVLVDARVVRGIRQPGGRLGFWGVAVPRARSNGDRLRVDISAVGCSRGASRPHVLRIQVERYDRLVDGLAGVLGFLVHRSSDRCRRPADRERVSPTAIADDAFAYASLLSPERSNELGYWTCQWNSPQDTGRNRTAVARFAGACLTARPRCPAPRQSCGFPPRASLPFGAPCRLRASPLARTGRASAATVWRSLIAQGNPRFPAGLVVVPRHVVDARLRS